MGNRNVAHMLVPVSVRSAVVAVMLRLECLVADGLVSAQPAASMEPPFFSSLQSPLC
jgi:hypothetical protein